MKTLTEILLLLLVAMAERLIQLVDKEYRIEIEGFE